MSSAERILAAARGEVGVKESPAGSNRVKYWDWYRERTGAGYQGQPWCAAFVAWCLCRASVWAAAKDEGRFRYCPSIVAWAKGQGLWRGRDASPRPGWLVLFANKGTACHVGIVESSSGGVLTTIEGNTSITSNDNGGTVMRRSRTLGTGGSSWYVLGYAAVADAGAAAPDAAASGASSEIRYRVRTGGRWLPEMRGHADTGGSGDDYAGNMGSPIEYLAMDVPKGGWYQAKTQRGGWLPKVFSCDPSDLRNGCAGDGSPIVAVRASGGVEYQAHVLGGGWLPVMRDLRDAGGSADDFAGNGKPIDCLRARLAES